MHFSWIPCLKDSAFEWIANSCSFLSIYLLFKSMTWNFWLLIFRISLNGIIFPVISVYTISVFSYDSKWYIKINSFFLDEPERPKLVLKPRTATQLINALAEPKQATAIFVQLKRVKKICLNWKDMNMMCIWMGCNKLFFLKKRMCETKNKQPQ